MDEVQNVVPLHKQHTIIYTCSPILIKTCVLEVLASLKDFCHTESFSILVLLDETFLKIRDAITVTELVKYTHHYHQCVVISECH
jgi:hypothetical protein